MNPYGFLLCLIGYFVILILISSYTSRGADAGAFYSGNKKSVWGLVMIGLIADSLSGVTFISLPGTVLNNGFSYLQLVIGYVIGYAIIAEILIPVYYRLQMASIYTYLSERFGHNAQMTGSLYFLLSRVVGASLRLCLAAGVLQQFVFGPLGIPFWITVSTLLGLMLLYTYKGGIKTLVWTDTLQSLVLLGALFFTLISILYQLDWGIGDAVSQIRHSDYSQVFFWDWREKGFFFKQLISGALIAVVMTGLDQNMMQKSLSCPNVKDAKRNFYGFSLLLVPVNILFVSLGAMLYIYAFKKGITLPTHPETGKVITDEVFPLLALHHLGLPAAIAFITGLTAATFSSADSVLTSLSTSFLIDIRKKKEADLSSTEGIRLKNGVMIVFGVLMLLVILISKQFSQTSILDGIFTAAIYTYGPLLGLFSYGLIARGKPIDKWIPLACIIPPFLSYLLQHYSVFLFNGYKFSYELLFINGLFTFCFLEMLSIVNRKYAKELG